MNQLAQRVISRSIILIIPFSGVMAVLAPQIISVLFQRGQFDAAATQATAPVLALYLVGAFAIASTTLVSRCFYALQNTWLPMILSTLAALGSIPLYITLSQSMGARGIALASSIFAISQFLVLYSIWIRKHSEGREVVRLMTLTFKIVGATALGCLLCFWISSRLTQTPSLSDLGTLLQNLAVGVGAGIPSLLLIYTVLAALGVANPWRKAKA